MACWLGGLVVLCVAVLPRRDVDELRRVLPRYSALALGAIVALVVSGAYQAWRQVGSIDELKSTDYGRLLIAKLVVFAALIVAAAFSREVVNRRFRDLPPDDDELVPAEDPVLVGAGGPSVGRRRRRRLRPERRGYAGDGGDWDDEWDDDAEDQEEMTPAAPLGLGRGRRSRRSSSPSPRCS